MVNKKTKKSNNYYQKNKNIDLLKIVFFFAALLSMVLYTMGGREIGNKLGYVLSHEDANIVNAREKDAIQFC